MILRSRSLTLPASLVAAGVFLADQATKTAARAALPLCSELHVSACHRIHVIGPIWFLRAGNAGGALGVSQGLWVWTFIAAVALVAILVLPRWGGASRAMAVASGLLLGGALGNLFDRLLFGRVTDFLDIEYSGTQGITINVADIALAVGAVLATWALYRAMFQSRSDARH